MMGARKVVPCYDRILLAWLGTVRSGPGRSGGWQVPQGDGRTNGVGGVGVWVGSCRHGSCHSDSPFRPDYSRAEDRTRRPGTNRDGKANGRERLPGSGLGLLQGPAQRRDPPLPLLRGEARLSLEGSNGVAKLADVLLLPSPARGRNWRRPTPCPQQQRPVLNWGCLVPVHSWIPLALPGSRFYQWEYGRLLSRLCSRSQKLNL